MGQTSKGRSFQLASCQPPLSAQRTCEGGPHLPMSFWVQHSKGEYESVLHWGSTLDEDTRVETANVNCFSSTTQVDGRVCFQEWNHSHITIAPHTVQETPKEMGQSAFMRFVHMHKRASDKMALASTLGALYRAPACCEQTSSIPRHGRVGRGREWSHHPLDWIAGARLTVHHPKVPKDQPSSKFALKEKEKVQQKVEQIFRTRA